MHLRFSLPPIVILQTCREEYKRKFPDEVVVFADFQKKCADRWKTMSEKEKRRFSQVREEPFPITCFVFNSQDHEIIIYDLCVDG